MQRTGSVIQRKHQADAVGACINFHVLCNADKSGIVVFVILHAILQNMQSIQLRAVRGGKRRKVCSAAFRNIFCCGCRVFKNRHLDIGVRLQEIAALLQCLCMRNNLLHILQLHAGFCQQRMADVQLNALYDIEFMAHHQVIYLGYRACGAVFDGQHAISAQTGFHRIEYTLEVAEIHLTGQCK